MWQWFAWYDPTRNFIHENNSEFDRFFGCTGRCQPQRNSCSLSSWGLNCVGQSSPHGSAPNNSMNFRYAQFLKRGSPINVQRARSAGQSALRARGQYSAAAARAVLAVSVAVSAAVVSVVAVGQCRSDSGLEREFRGRGRRREHPPFQTGTHIFSSHGERELSFKRTIIASLL